MRDLIYLLERHPYFLCPSLPAGCGVSLLADVERDAVFLKPHENALDQPQYLQWNMQYHKIQM